MKLQKLQNIFKGDRIIWIIFFLLCIISVLEVYSSSSSLGYKSGNYWIAAIQHTTYLCLGIGVMVFVLNIPCRYFKLCTPILCIIAPILLLWVLLFGTKTNDAARWINFFGIPLQPSEIAKGTLVLLTAHILSQLQTPEGAHPKAFKYIVLTSLFFMGLVVTENFSTAALMGATVFCMMIIGRVPWKQIGYLCSAVAILLVLAVSTIYFVGQDSNQIASNKAAEAKQLTESVEASDKQLTETISPGQVKKEPATTNKRKGVLHRLDLWKQRIDNFLNSERVDPHKYDLDKNSQVGHANIAIASSQFIGKGPGNSEQRDFLPLAFSDFIYAIIFEELGWLGAAFVALLYISLLFRTGQIARRCTNTFPAFLAMGLALLIVIQALFNMMVAVGLAPVTGQPLPLISKGGTSSIINCIYIGVILSISRTAKKRDDVKLEMA